MFPKAYEERMKSMLGAEYDAYAASFCADRVKGLRLNTLKITEDALPWTLGRVAWADEGRTFDRGLAPGRHALHAGGAYYLQEPSAMSVVAVLAPKPHERVLDLCAAPGGKTTQAAIRMQNTGLLVANEIVPNRASILSENVARMGLSNVIVTNAHPTELADRFEGYFDACIVDAPCSGEGMFRKDDGALQEWSEENVRACADRQARILHDAARCVRQGGRIVYSTCTFSLDENERNVVAFLNAHPDFALKRIDLPEASKGLAVSDGVDTTACARFWPHIQHGEGHFIALFERTGEARTARVRTAKPLSDKKAIAAWREFCKKAGVDERSLPKVIVPFGDTLYAVDEAISPDRLRVPRYGLELGTVKKDRFEPSWALGVAAGLSASSVEVDEATLQAYLAGEAFACDGSGWLTVRHKGLSYGWVKASAGLAKNHFPKSLRRLYDV